MEAPQLIGRPIFAVKLTPNAQQQQKKGSSDHLGDLIRNVLPNKDVTVVIQPLFTAVPAEKVTSLVKLATKLDPTYQPTDFSAWYDVSFVPEPERKFAQSGHSKSESVSKADVKLPGWLYKVVSHLRSLEKDIESFHWLLPSSPPAVNPADDDRSQSQRYLDPAPVGIDARYAWGLEGGDGKSSSLVDIEQGWDLEHPDLKEQGIQQIGPGINLKDFGHGTSVLGVIFMKDNNFGGVGIAPQGKGRVCPEIFDGTFAQPGAQRTADAILSAIVTMAFGDILLLESQTHDPNDETSHDWPVEIDLSTFEAIRVATAIGISVIQAAGNGAHDLDAYTSGEKPIFNKSYPPWNTETNPNPDYRDSGAVMVASASSSVKHKKRAKSNYGTRIDCYSWGQDVVTTTTYQDENTGDITRRDYTTSFNGTSSAAAIVAGAAMVVQSVAQEQLGYKFSPLQLRQMLSIGEESEGGQGDRIGRQPNLKDILGLQTLRTLPDVYVRDNIGDTGTRTSGDGYSSPDIIVLKNRVTDGAASFGEGSGVRNSIVLCDNVSKRSNPGMTHSIYIRAINKGGSMTGNVTATVYWAKAVSSVIAQPMNWISNKIGAAVLRNMPSNSILSVSEELPWLDENLPSLESDPMLLSFVCILNDPNDPAPELPLDRLSGFADWAQFVNENNNVACRNFNLVSEPSQNRLPYHTFAFLIPGAFDIPRLFSFKTFSSLPRGSSVIFKLPLSLSRVLGIKLRKDDIVVEKDGEFALVPLNPFGEVTIGEGVLDKGLLADCELRVQVPKDVYFAAGIYQVAFVHYWEGREIGRLTFRFGQKDRYPGDGVDVKQGTRGKVNL